MSQVFDGLASLQQQLQQLQQLEAILVQEKEILIKGSPEQLLAIGEQKNTLLLAIQTLDNQIEQSVQFRQEKAQGKYTELLAEIEQHLTRCQEHNQVNGKIIQQSQLAVERMKTSLLQSHNKLSVTYDSKGKTSGGLSSLGIKA